MNKKHSGSLKDKPTIETRRRFVVPDPIKARKNYEILNDGWEFSFDNQNWRSINVPFCPQSELSGIGYTDFIKECFYRKTFKTQKDAARTVLHFGAVDYRCILYVNDRYVGVHTGGFTPFEFDISAFLVKGDNRLLLIVYDEEKNIAFGKQSYKKQSFGCFYTRTTGIWQTVRIEYTPKQYIKNFYFYPDVEHCAVDVEMLVSGCGDYEIEVLYDGKKVGEARGIAEYKVGARIALSEKHLWDIGEGNLYDVRLRFCGDEISSYFGLRKVEYDGYRFLLNGREVFQKLVLDQGFYPNGLYTAPSEEALKKDVEAGVRLGFNGVRLHQKVFDPRYLYYCDKLGYMVWGEYPSWGIDYSDLSGLGQFLSEWEETMKRDFNHPSIITWCPLNEVWGDWENPRKKRDVRFIDAVYAFTKRFDCTRPCVDVSGGHHGEKTDLFDFHCYESFEKLKDYLEKFEQEDVLDVPLLYCDGENGRYRKGVAVNVSEYGGISLGLSSDEQSVQTINECAVQSESEWGYGKGVSDGEAFVARYKELTELIMSCKKISGYCYTQLYDVEQERNGFYNYDRSDKLTERQKDEIYEIQSKR